MYRALSVLREYRELSTTVDQPQIISFQSLESYLDFVSASELSDEEVLPSVRTLAAQLKISSLTVKKAYDLLEEEGFVTTVHGKGTFVNAADRQIAYEARRKTIEDEFSNTIEKALATGMNRDEIREMINIILED